MSVLVLLNGVKVILPAVTYSLFNYNACSREDK